LSFKERVEFSMIPAQEPNLSHHLVKGKGSDDISVLKTGVVYGANAAGKSNLIRAMDFAKQLITTGTQPNKFIPISPFKLDETYLDKPSRFEFEFKQGGKNYAYGFSLNHQWILEEWLYEINQVNEKPLFERQTRTDEEVIVTPGASLSDDELGIFKYTGNMGTRPNQLFLTEIAKLNQKKLKLSALRDSYQWFDKVLTIMFPDTKYAGFALEMKGDRVIQDKLLRLLKLFDTGISGIQPIKVDFDNQLKELPQAIKDNIALAKAL